MKVISSPSEGLHYIELKTHGDERGFFVERYRKKFFENLGVAADFVQDNQSRSAPGVLRGLHYQTNPPQGKLVGVVRGKIWDVAVDFRKNSPTFGQHFSFILEDFPARLVWIPYGFAHGFCVLGNTEADVFYKVTGYYNAAAEGGVRWNDPDLAIAWPIANPQVSPKDNLLPFFKSVSPL